MPPRPTLLDICRTSYICQSCLASLRSARVPPVRTPQPWQGARYLSLPRRRAVPQRIPRTAVARSRNARALQVEQPVEPDELEELEELDEPKQPLSVRYFNQEAAGEYRELKDNDQFNAVAGGSADGLGVAIEELEMQMENTIKLLELMEQKGMKEKADELRKEYGSKLQEQGDEGAEPTLENDAPLPQLAYLDLNTKTQKERVNALNRFMRLHRANQGEITPKIASFFWKLYVPCRQTLALSWARVPAEAWDIFWAVGSWDHGDNPNRMHHIHILAKDMRAAGVSLDANQQLLAIEAMFLEGLHQGAIDVWRKAAGTLGAADLGTFEEYWELGCRMCSEQGDVERALRAANTLLESSHGSDPRILFPLIRALAQKEATHEQAWESYRRLRGLLGESMKIEDYDEVIGCFLSTNSVEPALQVFVDMMFSGALDLYGKTKLPAQVANRFFLGKWLKRLIGAGDLDGAYKVVCYMASRGVTAAPIQLNGLLGAWMRSKTADNVERAEKLGWTMIRSRLLFVDLRRRQRTFGQGVVHLVPTGCIPDRDLPGDEIPELSHTPAATLETFSLMANNYLQRRLSNRMEELWVAFKQSEIGSDTFMMNQMIESYVQDGKATKVLEFYETMTKDHSVSPDAFTFLALFQSLHVNRLQRRDKAGNTQDVTQARKIFQDMVQLSWGFPSPHVFEQLPKLILFSLYQVGDYAGMIVAARTMKELFAFAPSETLLVDLAVGNTSLRKTRRPGKKAMAQLIQVGRYIESLLQQRQRDGRSLADMSPEEKAEELHAVLEILILRRAEANAPGDKIDAVLAATAEKMGAYDVAIARDLEKIALAKKRIEFSLQKGDD